MLSKDWAWPLAGITPLLPDDPGTFGAVRRYDVHTGVDLYCEEGQVVCAVEPGTVVAIEDPFTGGPDSPWWNRTAAVLVQGFSGVVVYGEVEPSVAVGRTISARQEIGHVVRVLKKDKGRPTSMLHLELMRAGSVATTWWRLGEPQPPSLLDPTPLLEAAAAAINSLVYRYDGVRA